MNTPFWQILDHTPEYPRFCFRLKEEGKPDKFIWNENGKNRHADAQPVCIRLTGCPGGGPGCPENSKFSPIYCIFDIRDFCYLWYIRYCWILNYFDFRTAWMYF